MSPTLRSVNILVRNGQGKTLLQMRDGAAALSPLLWSLWGGGVEEGDGGPRECAVRELAEELGIDAQPEDFSIVGVRESSTQLSMLLQYARPVEWGEFIVNEGAGAGFFDYEEITRLAVSNTLRHYLENRATLFRTAN